MKHPGDAPPPAPPQVGDAVGAYRLLRLIGEGASGRVFEALHASIGRRAAMKILSPEHAARPGAVHRMLSEAQAVNQINHPHIVEITDAIEADRTSGVNAIVMELLEGRSLAELLLAEGPLPPARYVPILAQVADALAAAHRARFVHRDLKPENVFLVDRGRNPDYVKLLDFGIAKSLAFEEAGGASPGLRHATIEGTFLGTPAYASPEQAAMRPVDHRTDIYSFGVILFELVHGRLPFEGRSVGEYLVHHLTTPPPPAPPALRADPVLRTLDGIARKCLQKEPAGRFSTMDEIKAMLDALLRGEEVLLPGAAPPPRRAARNVLVAGALVALAAIVGLGIDSLAARLVSGPAPPSLLLAGRPRRAPPAIAAPRSVLLKFVSNPPGAETRRTGGAELLGLTPFEQTFPRGEEAEFEMTLPGYEPLRLRVRLAEQATVGGPLRPKAAPPAAPAPKKSRGRPRAGDALVDPFAR